VDFGVPCRRKRFWGIAVSLKTVNLNVTSFDNILDIFRRPISPVLTYHQFMLGDSDPALAAEFDAMIDRLYARPKSFAKLHGISLEEARRIAKSGSWDILLTKPELDNLKSYESQLPIVGGTYQLNQYIRNGHPVTCTGSVMYSIVHSPSVHYNVRPKNRRAWLGSELLWFKGSLLSLACLAHMVLLARVAPSLPFSLFGRTIL
jgi:hypothetical protein